MACITATIVRQRSPRTRSAATLAGRRQLRLPSRSGLKNRLLHVAAMPFRRSTPTRWRDADDMRTAFWRTTPPLVRALTRPALRDRHRKRRHRPFRSPKSRRPVTLLIASATRHRIRLCSNNVVAAPWHLAGLPRPPRPGPREFGPPHQRTLQRRVKRPRVRTRDRVFWLLLATAWRRWRSA